VRGSKTTGGGGAVTLRGEKLLFLTGDLVLKQPISKKKVKIKYIYFII
tara:strand:- start:368 stop:511 length:144 start_codon:yes stop_codon:yes gene_type:complete